MRRFCFLPGLLAMLGAFTGPGASAQCNHCFHHQNLEVFDYDYRIIGNDGSLVYESSGSADYVMFETCSDGHHHIKFYMDSTLTDRYVIHSANRQCEVIHEGNHTVITPMTLDE